MTESQQADGDFLCPNCGIVRPFSVRRVSDVLTEYAVPLWSGGDGRYIECLECGEAFDAAILNSPGDMSDREFAFFRTLMVGVMVSMMDVDGSAHARELEAVKMIYAELAGGPVHASVLKRGIDMARVAGARGAIQLADKFNSRLDQLSRELVFRSALYISAADGILLQEEMDFLGEIGDSLGLDENHMHAIIESAQDEGHVAIGGRA